MSTRTCLIIDNSQESKKPALTVRSSFQKLNLSLVTNYVRNVVNCVYHKFFKLDANERADFITLLINDHFPQYSYKLCNNKAKKVSNILNDEKESFLKDPCLKNCSKCAKVVIEPHYFENKLYHNTCGGHLCSLGLTENSIMSYFNLTSTQSTTDKLNEIAYVNNLANIPLTITICIQISLEKCVWGKLDSNAASKIGFVVGHLLSNMHDFCPQLVKSGVKMTNILIYTDSGDIVTVESQNLLITIKALIIVHNHFTPYEIVVSKDHYRWYSSESTSIRIQPWHMFFHLYFELPKVIDQKFSQTFCVLNDHLLVENLTSFVSNYNSKDFYMHRYREKTVSLNNLPSIVLANMFKDSFVDSMNRHSSGVVLDVFSFSNTLTSVDDIDEYIFPTDNQFGDLDAALETLVAQKSYEHMIILSENELIIKSTTLRKMLKTSIIMTRHRNRHLEDFCDLYRPSSQIEFYELGQELLRKYPTGLHVSFVLSLNIHSPGENNSLLTSSNIVRLKNEFLQAKELFPVGLVNDSIVDWLLQINGNKGGLLLIYFTNMWPAKPPECLFIDFKDSKVIYQEYSKNYACSAMNLFVDKQNNLCLPLLSNEWNPQVTAAQVIKEIMETTKYYFNTTQFTHHKNYFINYQSTINHYNELNTKKTTPQYNC